MSTILEILSRTTSDVAAHGTSVGFDAPGGFYDRLFRVIKESEVLPKRKNGLLALITGAFATHSILNREIIGEGPIRSFVGSVTGSATRQLSRRALDAHNDSGTPGFPALPASAKGQNAFFEASADVQAKILQQFAQLGADHQRTYKEIADNCDVAQLTSISELPVEDIKTLLSFLAKRSFADTASDITNQVSAGISAGIQELTDRLNKWSGKKKKE